MVQKDPLEVKVQPAQLGEQVLPASQVEMEHLDLMAPQVQPVEQELQEAQDVMGLKETQVKQEGQVQPAYRVLRVSRPSS